MVSQVMDAHNKFEKLEVKSANELRDWLIKHYAQSESVWLVTWKKAANAPYVSRDEVLDQLIAFGWIDDTVAGWRARPSPLSDRTPAVFAWMG